MSLAIALVEDNQDLSEEISYHLLRAGMRTFPVRDSSALRQLLQNQTIDIVLLDLGLPGEDGLSIARWLSADPSKRIVMLTARTSLTDRIDGFTAGADIYLTKPVDMRELVQALNSVARRLPNRDDELVLNLKAGSLSKGNLIAHLTGSETRFLAILAQAVEGRVSKIELEDALYPPGDQSAQRKLEVLLSRLRNKFKKTGFPDLVRTDWGRGFTLTEQVRVVT